MHTRDLPFKAIVVLTLLALFLSACNYPGLAEKDDEETPDMNDIQTSVAQTVEAGLPTTPAPGGGPAPSPTATLPGAPPITPGAPATTAPPPQSGSPTIRAEQDTNCRLGPSKLYPILDYLLVGQQSTVHGRNDNSGNPWWYIKAPKKAGTFCWVWGGSTRVEGDVSQLPIITPPPPPTPTPTTASPSVAVTFSNLHTCGSATTAIFQVINNGGAALKSMGMTITDLVTSLPLYGPDISNAPFMAGSGDCPPGGGNLPNGSTGYVGGPLALPIPGHTAQADITLCSENGMGGVCLTASVQFNIP